MVHIKSFVPIVAENLQDVIVKEQSKSFYINTGFLSNAHGSCLLESGSELIIARIILHPMTNTGKDLFSVECKNNEAIGHIITKSIRPCICFDEIPNTVIRVQVEVLNGIGEYNCINAVSLALVDANIPMLGIVSAFNETAGNMNALMVCCQDNVTNCSLDGELKLFDQCYEGCQQVRGLMVSHFHEKYK